MTSAVAVKDSDDLSPTERAAPHVRSLVRYWWIVVFLAVAAAVIAAVLSERQTKQYDATSSVVLSSSEPVNVLLRSTGLPSNDPERELNTDVAMVKTPAVAGATMRQLHLRWTSARLLSEVTASLSGVSNVIAITAQDVSPRRAARIANAMAHSYVRFRREGAQAVYAQAATLARQRLASLTRQQKRARLGASLRAQLGQLETAGFLQTGGAQVIADAAVPTTPATPRPKFAAVVAGTVGLLLGALLAIGLGAMEQRREPAYEEYEDDLEYAPAGAGRFAG
jgi:uncharacterized protein involved in exopolysaccharide biosynthesis